MSFLLMSISTKFGFKGQFSFWLFCSTTRVSYCFLPRPRIKRTENNRALFSRRTKLLGVTSDLFKKILHDTNTILHINEYGPNSSIYGRRGSLYGDAQYVFGMDLRCVISSNRERDMSMEKAITRYFLIQRSSDHREM